MMRSCLVLAAVLGCFGLAAFAQTQPEKKADPSKGKEVDPGKGKTKSKADETGKDAASSLDKYLELIDEIKALKKQLIKPDEVLPSDCKLYGKLAGDYLTLKADFVFKTYQPNATVFVGMLGGHLMGAGKLDGQQPIIDAIDKRGFAVRVDKEGIHQLTLNLAVRVKSSGASTERSVELGLPNAASGSMQIDLPVSVKELRSNDELEKPKKPGQWLVPIGKSKQLKLSWKEPIAPVGNPPLYEVDGHVNVRIDDTQARVTAELDIKALRPTKEWQILLPPRVQGEAIAPNGDRYELQPPQGDSPYHTFKAPPAGGDRWQIAVVMPMPRPNVGARLPIGPFVVVGAKPQKVTITVQMPAEAIAGQRLVFHRQNGVQQLKNAETEAVFQYGIPSDTKPAPTAPLELEWRYDKSQLETQVKHALKWKTQPWGWQLDAETRIEVKTVFASTSAIDLRLPLPRQRGVLLAGTIMPGAGFPGAVPWGGLWADPVLSETSVFDDLGHPLTAVSLDSFGKTRVSWGSPAKKMTLVLKSTYRVAGSDHRMKLELPRPLNTQDRGAKLTIQADDGMELLHGPYGMEEAVPERHRFSLSWEQAPAKIDLAWRPHLREITAESIVDVLVHEHTAEVRQTITFPWDLPAAAAADPHQTHVRLHVPREIDKLSVRSEGKWSRDLASDTLSFQPSARTGDQVELVLQYDVALDKHAGVRMLDVPMVWPANVSRKDAKVRFWSRGGGVKIRLADELFKHGTWKERSIETVKDKDQFPVLVLQGAGVHLPLALTIDHGGAAQAAPFLAERGLIQAVMSDDGSQRVQARFLIRKFNAEHLDIELPLPEARFSDGPKFSLLGKQLGDWETIDPAKNVIRLKINVDASLLPGILEVQYVIPADALDHNTRWRTTLEAPIFRADPAIGSLRWQLTLPAPMIGATFGKKVRVDAQWTVQGWLLTPDLSGADLETWIAGKESAQAPAPVTFAFAQAGLHAVTIYHFPRQWWLLGCSGFFLIAALGVYFAPVPRFVFSLFLLGLAVGLLSLALVSPALLPAVMFGSQPGVVLLGIFVGAHWLWQERGQRQLMVLPAFSRTKSTSTVTMAAAAKRPREPSTVDAPAPADGGPPSSQGAGTRSHESAS